jgi:hypothetical protein
VERGLTIADVVAELNNWRRWRWAGMPNLEVPEPPAFELYRAYADASEDGGRGEDIAAAPPPVPIDEPAAEAMHALILEPHMARFKPVIYDHWFWRKPVDRRKLEAAHVAIMDTINRWSGIELRVA